jgi:hypothetical protein
MKKYTLKGDVVISVSATVWCATERDARVMLDRAILSADEYLDGDDTNGGDIDFLDISSDQVGVYNGPK